ncbi:MAG: hypothetical protein IKS59_00820 [Aeriscardovia sp.]|nr:hypothetical protein [Aeriscardovia sp.]
MNNHLSNFASYDMNKAADNSGAYDRQPYEKEKEAIYKIRLSTALKQKHAY